MQHGGFAITVADLCTIDKGKDLNDVIVDFTLE